MDIILANLERVNDYYTKIYNNLCPLKINQKVNQGLYIKLFKEDIIESIEAILKLAADDKVALIIIDYKPLKEEIVTYNSRSQPLAITYRWDKNKETRLHFIRQLSQKYLYTEIDLSKYQSNLAKDILMFGQFNLGLALDI